MVLKLLMGPFSLFGCKLVRTDMVFFKDLQLWKSKGGQGKIHFLRSSGKYPDLFPYHWGKNGSLHHIPLLHLRSYKHADSPFPRLLPEKHGKSRLHPYHQEEAGAAGAEAAAPEAAGAACEASGCAGAAPLIFFKKELISLENASISVKEVLPVLLSHFRFLNNPLNGTSG